MPETGFGKAYRDIYELKSEMLQTQFDLSKCEQVMSLTNLFRHTPRENSQLYVHRSICQLEIGQVDDAIKSLERAIEIDNYNTDAYNNLGNIYTSILKKPERSLYYYQRAVELAPDDLRYRLNLIMAYELLGSYREARQEVDRLLRKHRRNGLVWLVRGNLFYSMGNLKEALFSFSRAFWYDSSLVDALTNRGIVRIKLGDKHWGCRDLERAKRLGSDFAREQLQYLCNSK